MSTLSKVAYALTAAALFAAVTEPTSHADISMQYLGQRQIPHKSVIGGTRVGGLSGISYDPRRGLYYAISDDNFSPSEVTQFLALAM